VGKCGKGFSNSSKQTFSFLANQTHKPRDHQFGIWNNQSSAISYYQFGIWNKPTTSPKNTKLWLWNFTCTSNCGKGRRLGKKCCWSWSSISKYYQISPYHGMVLSWRSSPSSTR
jgi:hypothetical protein